MLQLREILEDIEKHYAEEYMYSGSFSAVAKGPFFSMVLNRKESGSLVL